MLAVGQGLEGAAIFLGDVGHGEPCLVECCAGTAWRSRSGTRSSTGHRQARPPVEERRDRGCESCRAARAIETADATDGRENARYDRLGVFKGPVVLWGPMRLGLAGRVSSVRARDRMLFQGGGEVKKSDIVAHVANRVSLSEAETNEAVNAVFEVIQDTLERGESVAVTGFGTFSTKSRPARTGRNPRTGESIAIAASTVPSFKAGKTLRDAVR